MTERMLIRHLHKMVQDGMIFKHDKKSVPPHVLFDFAVRHDARSGVAESRLS